LELLEDEEGVGGVEDVELEADGDEEVEVEFGNDSRVEVENV